MSRDYPIPAQHPCSWDEMPGELRSRGMRWTPQRRTLIEVLRRSEGHVLAADLVARCRDLDPTTTPSTVYRTLDVLESLGMVVHGHDGDGREEYHVLPEADHGHLYCSVCGGVWEVRADEASAIVGHFDHDRGFEVDLSHVTISGRCGGCRSDTPSGDGAADPAQMRAR
jgi:Fur family ferric uptake transcriptional regulator